MSRPAALVALAVLGAGVFLAGLELMVTAVALPAIVADLADWTELRRASWIVNGYLLVYVATMPLAGRLADLWGARRLLAGGLVLFGLGSLLAGRAGSLDELIAGRLVQGVGGGALVPVATAAASHLFAGPSRPRALGVVGALTFLGMAAGPFVGAAILEHVHAEAAVERLGLSGTGLGAALAPAWRWVFYLNVPVVAAALAVAWAAGPAWETPRRPGRVDLVGAALFTVALGALLVGLTLLGSRAEGPLSLEPATVSGALFAVAALGALLVVALGLRRPDPFLDPRLFRRAPFSSAVLVSLLTGYALATAIVGGAVFVDRVLYGGPGDQQLALGSLAAATAVGALVSGFAVRRVSLRLVTLAGIAAGAAALVAMAGWTPGTPIGTVAVTLGVFGLGFGLTVTPRSTAAVEAAGRRAFGIASAAVTVARMVGMAVGLAVLTAYGSTTIDRLSEAIYATPEAYKRFIPPELRDRPLRDGLVVEALESWASREATRVIGGIFLVAAGVTAGATPAALALGDRRGALGEPDATARREEGGDDGSTAEPAVAL